MDMLRLKELATEQAQDKTEESEHYSDDGLPSHMLGLSNG
eukprot:CAMPEP_0178714300 /NCGR_PEP_ID=MMETSP0699-20121125/19974_1 /TAXON_ID=265572 /ORGANISM="Extubocellulus spinifer, Strain CCMP396" /LENGTH=39 /DNA_ID= /DNA_START= /DNA_END= /DNA_ORIENTATION=